MYPDQPQQQDPQPQQLSGTYLDQIAAQPVQKTMSPMVLWAIIGGIVVGVIMLFALLSSLGSSQSPQRLY